jgi:hypothetical protein
MQPVWQMFLGSEPTRKKGDAKPWQVHLIDDSQSCKVNIDGHQMFPHSD